MASVEEYREGADRLVQHLAAEYDRDGVSRSAPDNIQFYYKAPGTFAFGGRRDLALRTLEQFEQRFLSNGRLKLDPIAESWAAYLAGWAAMGAGMLGRFDLAGRIMGAVSRLQDASQGGFVHKSESGPLLDTERSSAAAMGLIWSMQTERALEVASFLGQALDSQPEAGTFYTYFDPNGSAVSSDTDRNAYFGLEDEHARPALFATTIASLVWLGRVTREEWLFDLAKRYLKFILSHRDDPARMPLATKIGWAALMLSAHVEDETLIEFARRSGDYLLEKQEPEGSINFDAVPDVPKPVGKVWLVGWGCDAALTLVSLGNGEG